MIFFFPNDVPVLTTHPPQGKGKPASRSWKGPKGCGEEAGRTPMYRDRWFRQPQLLTGTRDKGHLPAGWDANAASHSSSPPSYFYHHGKWGEEVVQSYKSAKFIQKHFSVILTHMNLVANFYLPRTSLLFRNTTNVIHSLVPAVFGFRPLIPTTSDPAPQAENFPGIPWGASPGALFDPLGISQSFY